MKTALLSLTLLMALMVSPLFSYGQDEQISRYEASLSKKDIGCLFDGLAAYLSSAEDKRLFKLQQAAIKNLAKTGRYDEQYIIIVAGQKADIDLTTYYNKVNPDLTRIYIAGRKESLDPAINTVSKQCNVIFLSKSYD